jgi:pyridoxamine 5'-phosphate oxidase
MQPSIADIRKEYKKEVLSEENVHQNPFRQFERWWGDALSGSIDEANAMTLATATKQGKPSARTVLLKGYDERGFIFFTNYESKKSGDIAENPMVSLLFFWKELERQVRIDGVVEKVSEKESDEYFSSRPPGSQVGAWASPQSAIIPSREILEKKASEIEKSFEGKKIVRPPHWGGFLVRPIQIEFWQGRPNRLHDRIIYTKTEDDQWKIQRLAP